MKKSKNHSNWYDSGLAAVAGGALAGCGSNNDNADTLIKRLMLKELL